MLVTTVKSPNSFVLLNIDYSLSVVHHVCLTTLELTAQHVAIHDIYVVHLHMHALIPNFNFKWPEKHIKSRKIDNADKEIFCIIGRSYKY